MSLFNEYAAGSFSDLEVRVISRPPTKAPVALVAVFLDLWLTFTIRWALRVAKLGSGVHVSSLLQRNGFLRVQENGAIQPSTCSEDSEEERGASEKKEKRDRLPPAARHTRS